MIPELRPSLKINAIKKILIWRHKNPHLTLITSSGSPCKCILTLPLLTQVRAGDERGDWAGGHEVEAMRWRPWGGGQVQAYTWERLCWLALHQISWLHHKSLNILYPDGAMAVLYFSVVWEISENTQKRAEDCMEKWSVSVVATLCSIKCQWGITKMLCTGMPGGWNIAPKAAQKYWSL